jgi:lipid II:glycine glycyltransferase (peptidoglycan interpeptide bridge formation enzyme)
MKIPITQSVEWQKLQDDLGETSFLVTEKNYQYLAILKHTKVGNYLYCPYGPVLESKSALGSALKSLKNLAREQHAIFIRIEPTTIFSHDELAKSATKLKLGLKKSKDLNPKDTWVLNLTSDKATLITNFSQGTRTRYNTYEKKGLTVRQTKDPSEIRHLVALQSKLYQKKHLHAFSEKYLKTELEQPFASLYLVEYHTASDQTQDKSAGKNVTTSQPHPADGQVLAASLFFDYAGVRYYMQSAADSDFKRLPATVALLTKALFDAKDQGITSFDFWGIAPDGAPSNHPWAGFTEFKKSFGGEPCHYTGTYDLISSRAKYQLYTSTRKFGKIFRAKV